MTKPFLLLFEAVLLTCAALAFSLPACPPCGSKHVPYPLSTSSSCGDPAYKIRCTDDGRLLFDSSNNTYQISSISPSNQRLTIQPLSIDPDTCVAADFPTNGLQLDRAGPFNITSSNTILYLNCNASILNSPLDCSPESLCHAFINATGKATAACDKAACCAFRAGGSTTEYRIRLRPTGCRAYRVFVNLDPKLPVSRWPEPGVELMWATPSAQPGSDRQDIVTFNN